MRRDRRIVNQTLTRIADHATRGVGHAALAAESGRTDRRIAGRAGVSARAGDCRLHAAPAEPAAAPAVRDLRRRARLTQHGIRRRLGVPVETIRNWEQGKRMPRGPARALLAVIAHAPDTVFAALARNRSDRSERQAYSRPGWQRNRRRDIMAFGWSEYPSCNSSRPMAQEFRRSGSAPGSCAGGPARVWSSRRSSSAIATSTPRRSMRTSARSAKACAPPGCRRDDVFVTTKVWTTHFAPNDLERSTKESLAKLRLSEVDLLLLHWPNPHVPLAETLGALAHVRKLGMARHIGVSNFTVALDRGGGGRLSGAAGVRSGRIPSLSRPDQGAGGLRAAWPGGGRL